jgi:hypothetical protein
MDPLPVFGGFRELPDAFWCYDKPIAHADFSSYILFQ